MTGHFTSYENRTDHELATYPWRGLAFAHTAPYRSAPSRTLSYRDAAIRIASPTR
jgi:hypothetical protein